MSEMFMPPPLPMARTVSGRARRMEVDSTGVNWPFRSHPIKPSSDSTQTWFAPSVPSMGPSTRKGVMKAWSGVRASDSRTLLREPMERSSSPSLTMLKMGYWLCTDPVPSSKSPLEAFQWVNGPTSVAM